MIKNAPDLNIVHRLSENFFGMPVELERVTTGVSTFVYRIRLKDKTFYLRILPEREASFDAEVKVHELLLKHDLNVPKVIHFETINEWVKLSTMIVEEIPGCSMSGIGSAKEACQVLYQAGKQLAVINQIGVDGFGWIQKEPANPLKGEKRSFSEFYHEHLDKDLGVLTAYSFKESEQKGIGHILRSAFPLLDTAGGRLAHGDFDGSHIFHEHGNFTGIIDFGEMIGSSTLYDLGHFKLHEMGAYPVNPFDALIKGYQEIRKLSPEDYVEIDLWVLFIGIRRLGMIYGRPHSPYHDQLVSTVKKQTDLLNKLT